VALMKSRRIIFPVSYVAGDEAFDPLSEESKTAPLKNRKGTAPATVMRDSKPVCKQRRDGVWLRSPRVQKTEILAHDQFRRSHESPRLPSPNRCAGR
jgi:hypothetical protein